MPVRRLILCLAMCAAAAATLLRAQSTTQPASPPQFKSGISLLRVDASVIDDSGRAISDLKAEDFHVTIDGQPRKVAFARFTGASSTPEPSPAPGVATYTANVSTEGRAIAMVVDLWSIRNGNERPLLDTAAELVGKLRPSDAVGLVPLPGDLIDLTRDHGRVTAAIRSLRGTSDVPLSQHNFTLQEAAAFERHPGLNWKEAASNTLAAGADAQVIQTVIERECPRDVEVNRQKTFGAGGVSPDPLCPNELEKESRERVYYERRHIENLLGGILNIAGQLRRVQAPSTIVVISGGLGFEQESYARFQQVQDALKNAGIGIYSVQVDQPESTAGDMKPGKASLYSSADRQSGLANLATMSGGAFLTGVGRAKGVFERLRTEITEAYELAVEPHGTDLDGKPHEIKVTTTRKADVRARKYVVAANPPSDPAAYLASLIAQPVDVGDLPIAIAAHTVRGDEPATLKMMIRADIGHGAVTNAPVRYQAVVIGANGNTGVNVTGTAASDGRVVITTQLAPGKYRVRFAAVEGSGRAGTLEVPIVAGLRSIGGFQIGDVIVGTVSGQSLEPSIYAAAGNPIIPTLEMTTADSARFATTSVNFEVRKGKDVVGTSPGRLEQTQYDMQQIARGSVPTASLAPGEYTLSAVISADGQPQGRVSRTFVLEPAAARAAPSTGPAPAAVDKTAAAPIPAVKIADAVVDDALHKAAAYVAAYGEKMSAVVGVERYTQNLNPSNGAPPPRPRQIVAEFALVKSGGPFPWTGYRDVIEVNGEAVTDRRDRIVKILSESSNPLDEAARLTVESTRYNLGPVSRNFNVPTSALFFFHESNLGRFAFTRKGTRKIDGIDTIEIAFKETAHPTLITTRAGKDVPAEGTVWVLPADGTIVRTRLQLKGFTDLMVNGDSRPSTAEAPPAMALTDRRGGTPNSNTRLGTMGNPFPEFATPDLQSSADIEVTYKRDDKVGMWLPVQMIEEYQGQIPWTNQQPITAIARSRATYSDYKQFATSSAIVGVKK